MRLGWTRQALADLAEIRSFIAQDRPLTAGRVARRIRSRARLIATHPFAGRRVEDAEDPDVREVIQERYRVVYRVTAVRIEILRVVDGARLLASDELGERAASYGIHGGCAAG